MSPSPPPLAAPEPCCCCCCCCWRAAVASSSRLIKRKNAFLRNGYMATSAIPPPPPTAPSASSARSTEPLTARHNPSQYARYAPARRLRPPGPPPLRSARTVASSRARVVGSRFLSSTRCRPQASIDVPWRAAASFPAWARMLAARRLAPASRVAGER
ncbi:unnamed protein product, partial [Ectocarpus sp. 13 AM-2016]